MSKELLEVSIEQLFNIFPWCEYFYVTEDGRQQVSLIEPPYSGIGYLVSIGHRGLKVNCPHPSEKSLYIKEDGCYKVDKVKDVTLSEIFKMHPEYSFFAKDKDGDQYLFREKPNLNRSAKVWKVFSGYSPFLRLKKHRVLNIKPWDESLVEKLSIQDVFKKFPEYNFFAEDGNGAQYLFKKKPSKDSEEWLAINARRVSDTKGIHGQYIVMHDRSWEDSLVEKVNLPVSLPVTLSANIDIDSIDTLRYAYCGGLVNIKKDHVKLRKNDFKEIREDAIGSKYAVLHKHKEKEILDFLDIKK